MANIMLLATGWGPKFGGINAFNHDLAAGLAAELRDTGKVFCAVPNPDEHDLSAAEKEGVKLIPLPDKKHTEIFDSSWPLEVDRYLRQNAPGTNIDWWVGHDVKSGGAAMSAAQHLGGCAALIQHMSYIDYQGYKSGDAVEAEKKHNEQRKLFRSEAACFGVGPKLTKACTVLKGASVTRLVPGFPEILNSPSTSDEIVAITFGRMEAASDRIKQGRLAVNAFGHAIARGRTSHIPIKALKNPRLYLLGLGQDLRTEVKILQSELDMQAGGVVNFYPLPFDENRESLFQRLSEANLALMLSWHEGFGLTGWEAIAYEIPLIIGENSGLFELIDETLQDAGKACVQPIDVRGHRGEEGHPNFTEEDMNNTASAILKIAADLPRHKTNAGRLKELLVSKLGCTWGHTARAFLNGLSCETTITHQPEQFKPQPPPERHYVPDSPFEIGAPYNAVPHCAELLPIIGQGSTLENFDALAEARFGREEVEVDSLSISYGLREAFLRLRLTNCRIRPGVRLGDDNHMHPDIAAQGDNTWVIRGPTNGRVLERRALGTDTLCSLEAEKGKNPEVIFELGCRKRNIDYEIVYSNDESPSLNKEHILRAFLTKALGAEGTEVILSRAEIRGKDGRNETN